VGVFSEEEALAFLADRISRNYPTGARQLARELGYLPLALAQAAAVIAGQWLSYEVYMNRLRAVPVQESLTPVDGEPYPRGVAEAVLLSIDAVAAADRTGLCISLLDMVSLLSRQGVSHDLMYAAGTERVLAEESVMPQIRLRPAMPCSMWSP